MVRVKLFDKSSSFWHEYPTAETWIWMQRGNLTGASILTVELRDKEDSVVAEILAEHIILLQDVPVHEQ